MIKFCGYYNSSLPHLSNFLSLTQDSETQLIVASCMHNFFFQCERNYCVFAFSKYSTNSVTLGYHVSVVSCLVQAV